MESFSGRLAIVTGGASGMGRELVVQLAAEGCSVATCDLNEREIRETQMRALSGAPSGVRVTAHVCDVADERSIERFRDEVLIEHVNDHIDLLFNNAGIHGHGAESFVAGDREEWERVFSVCWNGVYYCTRVFMPQLMKSPEGVVVNTSSVNSIYAKHGAGEPCSAYAVAKFAVRGFSEALIEDLRINAPNVRVAVVMPGTISTGLGANSGRILGHEPAIAPGDAADRMRKFLSKVGFPLPDANEEDLQQIQETMVRTFVTPADEAVTTILSGIRRGQWRILVGADAWELDESVRTLPEHVYDVDGPTQVNRDLRAGVLTLVTRFDSNSAADVEGDCELLVGRHRLTCRISDRHLKVERTKAPGQAAVAIATDPTTFRRLTTKETTLDEELCTGAVTLVGDRRMLEQLLAAVRPAGESASQGAR